MRSISHRYAKHLGGVRLFSSPRLLLVGLILVCACVTPVSGKAACELRVGWDEWPPYITYEDGRFRGLEYELLKSTAEAAGCELDMKRVPWARALVMLGEGKLDLLYGAGYSDERAKYANFSVPYRQEQFVLVTKFDKGDKTESVSLLDWILSKGKGDNPRALGLFRGNTYGEGIEQILKSNETNVRVVRLNKNEQMVSMVGLGRLDGFIVEDGVAQMLMQEPEASLQRHIIEEQVADPLHYMFSKQVADEIIQRFNSAIRQRLSAVTR